MYNQLPNEESGLSPGWMNLQALALSTVNGKGLILPLVMHPVPGGALDVHLFPGSSCTTPGLDREGAILIFHILNGKGKNPTLKIRFKAKTKYVV